MRVKPVLRRCALAACFLFACDSEDKAPKGKADAKADAKGGKKAGEKGDKEKGETKKPAGDAVLANGAAKPLDVSHDKSGIVARSAAALEAVDKIDSEDLRELSHHAEKLPSFDKVCGHIASLRGETYDTAKCIKEYEHHVVHIGPELYGEVASCELAAKTVADLDACDKAEAEAEKTLHEKPHGDGLDAKTCEAFFVQFETLAMDDAGDDAELVKEVLEEVKSDILEACQDQGTKAEIECGTKAKTLHDLRECSGLL